MKRRTRNDFLTVLALVGLTCGLGSSITPIYAQTADAKPAEDGKQPEAGQQVDAVVSSCPKCKGAMEPGIVRDYWSVNGFEPTVWAPAHQKMHLFSQGTKIKIAVYRCTNCGYLESYAK